MRRCLFSLLITITLFVFSCESKQLYIPHETNDISETTPEAISNYIYENYETLSAITPSEFRWYSKMSRGIILMPNDGILRVYNPEAGTLNALCPDPLCSHQPYSGCPYGNCIFTGSIPVEHDGRLYYYVKDQYLKNEQLLSEYKIYSTDSTGQKIKKHYDNTGNYIYGVTIYNDTIYFLEFQNEKNNLLRSINLKDGSKHIIESNDESGLTIISFICMNKTIYYMLDNGHLYSCDLDFKNNVFIYDTVRTPAVYGQSDLNKLFWCLDNKIYQCDPITKSCSEMFTVTEDLHIINFFPEDEGFYFQAVPLSVSVDRSYSEYIQAIKQHNELYFIDRTGNTIIYSLPEDLYLQPNAITVCNGLLISQTFIENAATKKLAGRPYKAYHLTTKELYRITEVSGY